MIKIVILIALLKLLDITGKPLLCSGIYTGMILAFSTVTGGPFLAVIISTVLGFVLSTAYFALLDYFNESGYYWIIMIVGLLIGLV